MKTITVCRLWPYTDYECYADYGRIPTMNVMPTWPYTDYECYADYGRIPNMTYADYDNMPTFFDSKFIVGIWLV